MPITLGDTSITGLGIGGLPSGVVNATSLANSAVTAAKMGYAGALLSVRYYEFTTQLSLSGPSAFTIWSSTDTKMFDSSTTDIYVFFTGTGRGNSGGHAGMYFEYDGVRQYEFVDYDYSTWGANNVEMGGNMRFTGRNNGSRAFSFGWSAADGSATTPAQFWNPNQGTSDSRARKGATNVIIHEVRI